MGQGLSKYQEKTGVAMDNYLEENLSKLTFTTDSESTQPDIPMNKSAIQKSIIKMDAIAQDAMTSKKELQELMKSSENSDTGSLSAYLQSMTSDDDDDDEQVESANDQNQMHSKQRSSSFTEEPLDESSTAEDTDAAQEQDPIENANPIPEFIPIHSKSSIYGSSHAVLKVNDVNVKPQQEMIPIPVKSASSIYGTSRKLLDI
jgi:hypothetical protein